jgi:hypothetical protein
MGDYYRPKTRASLVRWLKFYWPDLRSNRFTTAQLWAMYFNVIRKEC